MALVRTKGGFGALHAWSARGLLPLPTTPCRRFDFQVVSALPPGFRPIPSAARRRYCLHPIPRVPHEPDSIDCADHRRRARRLRCWKRLKGNELGHNRQRNRRRIRRRCRWSGLIHAAWVERHRTSCLSLINRRSQRRARYASHWISKIQDIRLRRLLPCLYTAHWRFWRSDRETFSESARTRQGARTFKAASAGNSRLGRPR